MTPAENDRNLGPPAPLVNPYIVGNPIESEQLFFGRQDDFAYINNKITGSGTGGILVLCGTRRSGKTSILFQIKNGRLGEQYLPVLLDMQSLTVGRDAEFLARLAQEIARTLADSTLIAEATGFRAADDETAYQEFRRFLARLPASLAGRQLVLLFDEYEIIESCIRDGKLSLGILRMLANWLEHEHGVFIIFAGSDKLELRNPRYWQSFLGKALHRRISFLSRNDTLRLVRDPVAGNITYDDESPSLIYELTNGQPFYTQVICQSLVDLLNEENRREVFAADVNQVVAEIIENPLPHMIFAWSSLDAIGRMILSCLATVAAQPGTFVNINDLENFPRRENLGFTFEGNRLREATERLFGQDLLIKNSDGDAYAFKMDLWRQWVGRMHSTWQVLDEIGGQGGPNQPADLNQGGILTTTAKHNRRTWVKWTPGVAVALGLGLIFLWWANRGGQEGVVVDVGSPTPVLAAPDSGWVRVLATPAGALVKANGQILGLADGGQLRLPVGPAQLELSLDQHANWRQTVPVGVDSITVVQVDLARETGALRVTSQPSGAEIFVDGEPTGRRTPALLADLPVRQGYRVDLRADGMVNWSSPTFAITAGDTQSIERQMSAANYSLTIATTPPEAEVVIAGRNVGLSPVQVTNLSRGRQPIEARLTGYETLRTSVDVPARYNMVSLRLQPLAPGTLVIKVINTYAEIWVDGKRVAQQATNHQVELSAGKHLIELRNPAFTTHRTEVDISPGQTSICEHTFRKGGAGE